MLNNILAVAWKEFQILVKDRGSLFVLFLMPLMFASIVGSVNVAAQEAMGEGGDESSPLFYVALTNLDDGEYGTQMVDALATVEALDITTVDTLEGADALVGDGEIIAAIVIPENFTADVDAYQPTNILVILDPVSVEIAGTVTDIVRSVSAIINLQGEIQYGVRTVIAENEAFAEAPPEVLHAVQAQSFGAIMTQLSALESNAQISVEIENLAGEEVDTYWNPFTYYVPGFTVMFAFFLTTIVGGTMLKEKEDGALRRLLAAPIHRGVIIAGKMLTYMLVICVQVALLFGVGHGFFDMPLGHVPGLVVLTVALSLTATSLGMLVAAVSATRKQADNTGMVLALVLAGIGGCLFPFYNQGGFMAVVSKLTPHAHALIGFSKAIEGGITLVEILPQAGILAGFGVAFFLIAVWRFEFE